VEDRLLQHDPRCSLQDLHTRCCCIDLQTIEMLGHQTTAWAGLRRAAQVSAITQMWLPSFKCSIDVMGDLLRVRVRVRVRAWQVVMLPWH
jgi:hypothetical protein